VYAITLVSDWLTVVTACWGCEWRGNATDLGLLCATLPTGLGSALALLDWTIWGAAGAPAWRLMRGRRRHVLARETATRWMVWTEWMV
jgi:hypothetical protein